MLPASFAVYLILAFGFDVNGDLAGAVGRDPTLTGRSDIWKLLLNMHTNPILGVGYESFWLGPRLDTIWKIFGHINESHNGYLEVYLNLGFVGAFLLIALLISAYKNINRQVTLAPDLASLNVALWAIILFYNMSEAAFKSGLMWVMFLLGATVVPQGSAVPERVMLPVRRGQSASPRRPSLQPLRQHGPRHNSRTIG